MGLREEIEGLRPVGKWGGTDDARTLIDLAEVLAVVDKHAAPVVDMTKGGTLVRLVQVPARPILPVDPDDIDVDADDS